MEKQLLYNIAGINYMLFEIPVTGNTDQKKLQAQVLKYRGMVQGVKQIKTGFLSSGYAILNVLIPEQHAIDFNNES